MGIRSFFHKVKMGFVRACEPSIPYVEDAKQYGNDGEDEFILRLCRELPSCKIKRNVVVSTPEGKAEIDCLLLYQNKLFAIEVKRWKGRLIEQEDGFWQEKTDHWTGEIHTKHLKSPFKQVSRAVYLLRKKIPTKAWINTIVFFDDNELESISVGSDNVWFKRYQDLIEYIRNNGKASLLAEATEFLGKCRPSDYLYANARDKSLHCIIDRAKLQFNTSQESVSGDKILSIRITHHWSCDDLHIMLIDGTERMITLENAKIQVSDNGKNYVYALCKIDYIVLGRTLNSPYAE